ncbi:MAG: tetratricopeptide repeat protein [Planctomycetes bacterium]|nr:tetratricopeptide repeat protein [Planctomycetota bacterium]
MRIVALAHERDRRDDEARAAWALLAEAAPSTPQGMTAAAAAARLARERGRARELAERAAEAAPDYAPALVERAVSLALDQRAADALACARAAVQAWPDDALSHMILGYTSLTAGDRRGARAALDEAVRLGEPGPEPAALLGRARLNLEERRLDHALADVERVLTRSPDLVEALVLRGVALHELADTGDQAARRGAAEDAWRQAHDLAPDDFLLAVEDLPGALRAAAREAAGVPPAVVARERPPVPLDAATRARLQRWVQPLEPRARRLALHALLAAAEGRSLSHIEPRLRSARALDGDSERLASLSARLLAGRDAYEAALSELEQARALGAPAGPLDLLRGEVLWFQGLGHEAVPVWDALAHREPASAVGQCAAAWAHFARQDYQAAAAVAAEATRRGPELASAWLVLGLAHRQEQRHAEGRAAFRQVLALEGAIVGRAAVFELDSDLEPAIQAHGWGRESTPEIDAGMERLEALFEIGGATSRLVAVQNALLLGPRSRWFDRCDRWLDDAKAAEPRRGELDMWHGWVSLHRRSSAADDVLDHWRRGKAKEPKIVLSKNMKDAFRQRFGDHPGLAEFQERQ